MTPAPHVTLHARRRQRRDSGARVTSQSRVATVSQALQILDCTLTILPPRGRLAPSKRSRARDAEASQ
jgi:hypothetical protein